MNVFMVSKILGIFPYTNQYALEKSLVVYSFVSQLYLISAWTVIMSILLFREQFSLPSTYLDYLLHVMSRLLNIFCVLAHLLRVVQHGDFIGRISSYLQVYAHNKMALLTLGMMLEFCRSAVIVAYRIIERSFLKTVEELIFLTFNCLRVTFSLQFCLILLCMSRKTQNLVSKMTSSHINVDSHSNIVSILRKVNDIFGPQLLILFCQMFVAIVSNGYWLIVGIIYAKTAAPGDNFFMASYVFSLLSTFFEVSVIVKAVQDTSFDVESFNVELFRLMRDSKHLCENENLYLYASMKNGVIFTACGFFNLGYPLVTSIIAAAATYLVILIQFSSNSDGK